MGYTVDSPNDARGSKMQIITFFKFHPKIQVYFSLISKDQEDELCLRNTFSTFKYLVETSL